MPDSDRGEESLNREWEAAETPFETKDAGLPTRALVKGGQVVLGCGCFTISTLVFFASIGGVILIVWGWLIPDWRANHRYVAGSCQVLDKKLDETTMEVVDPDGGQKKQETSYCPQIKIRYEAAGRKYEAWTYEAIKIGSPDRGVQQTIIDNFQVGGTYPCWYDPDSPDKVVLVRSAHLWLPYLLLLIPIAFLVIACGGLFVSVMLWRTGGSSAGNPAPIPPEVPPTSFEIRPSRAKPRKAFDPAQVGDPIARRTEWAPMKRGGFGFRTRSLFEVDADRLEFRASMGVIVIAVFLLLQGIGTLIGLAASSLSSGRFSFSPLTLLPLLLGLVIPVAGCMLLYSSTTPIVLDKRKGFFWKGAERRTRSPTGQISRVRANSGKSMRFSSSPVVRSRISGHRINLN